MALRRGVKRALEPVGRGVAEFTIFSTPPPFYAGFSNHFNARAAEPRSMRFSVGIVKLLAAQPGNTRSVVHATA